MSLSTDTTMQVVPAYGNGYGNGGMFGGDWGWLLLFLLFGGWGGYGFGGGRGGAPCATQADVRAAVDQQTLISKLDQQTNGISDATYALNNTITNGFHGVDRGLCDVGRQVSDCCCATQRLIERGFADTNYNLATQSCETRNLIQNVARDITDNANANTRAVLDFLNQSKIDNLRDENQALRLRASQQEQDGVLRAAIDASAAEIIRRTGNEYPTPAYWVQPPTPVQAPWSWTHGFGNYGNCGNGFATA